MKMKFAAIASVLPLFLCAPLAAQVVPNGLENTAGNSNIGALVGNQRPARHQQVYAGSEVTPGTITSIYFRQDEIFGTTAASCTLTNATVILSSTTADIDALSATFADNLGADATVVFQGDLVMSSTDTTSVPRPFEFHIPFTTPFTFDPGAGVNLVVDITLPDPDPDIPCVGFPVIDREYHPTDGVSSAFCFNGSCSPTFDTASSTETSGIVTLFAQDIFSDGFESGDTTRWSSSVP